MLEKAFEPFQKHTEEEELRSEEQTFECEHCQAIQEEMSLFFEADGLTYTDPEKE